MAQKMATTNPLDQLLSSDVDESVISALVGSLESQLAAPTAKDSPAQNLSAPVNNNHIDGGRVENATSTQGHQAATAASTTVTVVGQKTGLITANNSISTATNGSKNSLTQSQLLALNSISLASTTHSGTQGVTLLSSVNSHSTSAPLTTPSSTVLNQAVKFATVTANSALIKQEPINATVATTAPNKQPLNIVTVGSTNQGTVFIGNPSITQNNIITTAAGTVVTTNPAGQVVNITGTSTNSSSASSIYDLASIAAEQQPLQVPTTGGGGGTPSKGLVRPVATQQLTVREQLDSKKDIKPMTTLTTPQGKVSVNVVNALPGTTNQFTLKTEPGKVKQEVKLITPGGQATQGQTITVKSGAPNSSGVITLTKQMPNQQTMTVVRPQNAQPGLAPGTQTIQLVSSPRMAGTNAAGQKTIAPRVSAPVRIVPQSQVRATGNVGGTTINVPGLTLPPGTLLVQNEQGQLVFLTGQQAGGLQQQTTATSIPGNATYKIAPVKAGTAASTGQAGSNIQSVVIGNNTVRPATSIATITATRPQLTTQMTNIRATNATTRLQAPIPSTQPMRRMSEHPPPSSPSTPPPHMRFAHPGSSPTSRSPYPPSTHVNGGAEGGYRGAYSNGRGIGGPPPRGPPQGPPRGPPMPPYPIHPHHHQDLLQPQPRGPGGDAGFMAPPLPRGMDMRHTTRPYSHMGVAGGRPPGLHHPPPPSSAPPPPPPPVHSVAAPMDMQQHIHVTTEGSGTRHQMGMGMPRDLAPDALRPPLQTLKASTQVTSVRQTAPVMAARLQSPVGKPPTAPSAATPAGQVITVPTTGAMVGNVQTIVSGATAAGTTTVPQAVTTVTGVQNVAQAQATAQIAAKGKPAKVGQTVNIAVQQVSQQSMLENVKKCKNFLSTLIKLASSQPADTVKNVKNLIQGLIDGKIQPEDFTGKLQVELKSSPQPCLVPFLKKSLPLLRQSMSMNKMQIEGVRPPPPEVLQQNAAAIAAMAQSVRPVTMTPRPAVPNAAANQKQTGTKTIRPAAPQVIMRPQMVSKANANQSKPGTTKAAPSLPTTVTAMQPQAGKSPVQATQHREKRKYEALKDDDDINDVATMGGVNLSEESRNILATNSELMSGQLRSCKDESFLATQPLLARINEKAKRLGLEDTPPEVAQLVSHATQEMLRNMCAKLSNIAEHRLEIYKGDSKHEVRNDVKSQLKFLEELDKLEKKRHEEAEREILLRAAKSRSKHEDPEQAKLKEKAKALQQAEMEEVRQREANLTALAAIGPRKKKKLNEDAQPSGSSSSASGSGNLAGSSNRTSILRPRIKRVNLRDLIFLMEQERESTKSNLLYRTYLK